MADSEETKTAVSAAAPGAPAPVSNAVSDIAAPVEFPARTKRAATAKAAPAPVAKADVPVDPAPAPATRVQAAAKSIGPKRAAKRGASKPAPAKSIQAKPTVSKPVQAKPAQIKPGKAKAAPTRPASGKVAPMASRKPDTHKIKTAAKTSGAAATPAPIIAQLKEIPMDVTNSITDAVNSAQEKAKEAFTKTSAAAGEYGEFAKGNVQACVESGKILASGLQEMGSKMVADSKSAFETVSADMKALGGIKSPGDLFKLQGEIMRRNFETAIAYGSKNSEAMLKLTNDVIAPLSGRVTLAVEKLKKVA
jgi:hypothetical protein